MEPYHDRLSSHSAGVLTEIHGILLESDAASTALLRLYHHFKGKDPLFSPMPGSLV